MAPATQGKWGVHQQDGHFYVVNEHGGILAIIDRGRQPEEALANAQLMSAAPLLQASCVELAGALAAAMRAMTRDPKIVANWDSQLRRLSIDDGIGSRAAAAIAAAQGRGG